MHDLDAYLERLAHRDSLAADLPTLEALHLAHAGSIPFENLDVLLKRPIRLDLESLEDKLVARRRGGYCFEHNTLFAAVLKRLGFRVTELAARVRRTTHRVLPRTHMCLLVEIEGRPYLADVGFGSELILPVPLRVGAATDHFGRRYRLLAEPPGYVLQLGDQDLYAFTLEPQHPVDYEMANHFTATHPGSIFTQVLTAQLARPEGRTSLRNDLLSVETAHGVEEQRLEHAEQLLATLRERFGIDLPEAGALSAFLPSTAGTS